MREWQDIVDAYERLAAEGKPSALATVVRVEGSAYRRAGARMLIAEDGRTWGGVSGGCLERDVAARARGVIAAGQPFVQRYDTSDEELIARGVSTGCGGTIEVLLQPLTAAKSGPLETLRRVVRKRVAGDLVTVIRADGDLRQHFGLTYDATSAPSAFLAVADNPERRVGRIVVVDSAAASPAGSADVLIERLLPTQRLVIVGAGPDAVPVVSIAKTLGWHVAVVAAKPALSLESRFGQADECYVTAADAPLEGVPLSADDAVVVMTHNLARDGLALAALLVRPRYLGLLGPRHRTARVLSPLPDGHPGRSLHSPVGLDLGSNSPEEIALSIVAEIQSCLRRGIRPTEWRAESCRA